MNSGLDQPKYKENPPAKRGDFLSQGNEDRVPPGLLYGMPLTGTACATRDFAHAQNHPSDGRPHAMHLHCAMQVHYTVLAHPSTRDKIIIN